jgi:hypothetical protein
MKCALGGTVSHELQFPLIVCVNKCFKSLYIFIHIKETGHLKSTF